MLYRATTTFRTAPHATHDLALPMSLRADGVVYELSRGDQPGDILLEAEVSVSLAALELEEGDERNSPTVRVPDEYVEGIRVQNLADFLTFVLDESIRFTSPEVRLVGETPEETSQLDAWATDKVYRPTSATVSIRTSSFATWDDESFGEVFSRTTGLQLFAEAKANSRPSAQFRDLWRVLESAFHAEDTDLVDRLAQFEPARVLDFTEEELHQLYRLRGRVSHAKTKSGFREIARGNREASKRLSRLQGLVEQVIANKQSWGTPSSAHVWRFRPEAYVGPEGEVVIKRTKGSA